MRSDTKCNDYPIMSLIWFAFLETGSPGSVVQAGLEFTMQPWLEFIIILWSQPSKFWDYRHVSPFTYFNFIFKNIIKQSQRYYTQETVLSIKVLIIIRVRFWLQIHQIKYILYINYLYMYVSYMCVCTYVYKSKIYLSSDLAIALLGIYPVMYLDTSTKIFLLRFHCSIIYNRKQWK